MGMGSGNGGFDLNALLQALSSAQQQGGPAQQPAMEGPSAAVLPKTPLQQPVLEGPASLPAPSAGLTPSMPDANREQYAGLFSRGNPRAAALPAPPVEAPSQLPSDGGLWQKPKAPPPAEPKGPGYDQDAAMRWSQNNMFEGRNPYSGKWDYGGGRGSY